MTNHSTGRGILLEDSVLCIIQSRASFLASQINRSRFYQYSWSSLQVIYLMKSPTLAIWKPMLCIFINNQKLKVFNQKGNITFWQLLLWPFLHLTLLLQRWTWRLISWHRHCAINFQSLIQLHVTDSNPTQSGCGLGYLFTSIHLFLFLFIPLFVLLCFFQETIQGRNSIKLSQGGVGWGLNLAISLHFNSCFSCKITISLIGVSFQDGIFDKTFCVKKQTPGANV